MVTNVMSGIIKNMNQVTKEISKITENSLNETKKGTREYLTILYKEIRMYKSKISETEKEQLKLKRIKSSLIEDLKEDEFSTNLEKMKAQMDLFIIEAEEKEKLDISNENPYIDSVLNQIQKIENIIYVSCRFNTTWYPSDMKKLTLNYMKDFNDLNKDAIEEGRNYVLEELKPIYEYYIKAQGVLKNDKEKLDMLEELIDGMAAEVIKKDMKENNVVLPEFVRGMKYFKHEDEE